MTVAAGSTAETVSKSCTISIMTPGDEARRQNEGVRAARSEPLLLLLFMCQVNMMPVNHRPMTSRHCRCTSARHRQHQKRPRAVRVRNVAGLSYTTFSAFIFSSTIFR